MSFHSDHQLLEADRLLFGQRIAKALQLENRTSPSSWSPARLKRKRAAAIVLRVHKAVPKPTLGSKAARRRLALVRALADRDGLKCRYCEVPFGSVDDPEITIDHIVSRSEGGTSRQENLCLACAPCNEWKGGIHGDTPRYLRGLPSRTGLSAWRAS